MGKEFLLGELIGTRVRIVDATDPTLIGLEGVVLDETMKMFFILTEKGVKRVQKRVAVFEFLTPSGERIRVDGRLLEVRPEERTKKLWRRLFRKQGLKNLRKQDIVV